MGALALGGFGGILLWATSLLLLSPMPGEHPLAVLAFKLFVLGILGFTGLTFCAGALMLVIPGAERRLEPTIPRAVRKLCPGCGHSRSIQHSCAHCGLPPAATQSHWIAEEAASPRPLALLPISLGIFALGVLLLVKMTTRTSDISWWTNGVLLAASLLTMLVGLLGIVGIFYRPASRKNRHDFTAHVSTAAQPPAQHHTVHASLKLRKFAIHRAEGFSLLTYPPALEPASLAVFPPEEALVYRFLAAATLRKLLGVSRVRRIDWSLSPVEDGQGGQSSYREAPRQDELNSHSTSGRAIFVVKGARGRFAGDKEDRSEDPLQGLLSAIHSVRTVEQLIALVQADASLQERVQEELFALSQNYTEQEIEHEAGLIAASSGH